MEQQLFEACSKLRSIIEHNIPEIIEAGYDIFQDYPIGCCEKSTHLLSHYLINNNLCKAEEMRMPWNNYDKKGEWECCSHGWISLNKNLNLDITADQLSGITDKVIVSSNHEVHLRFTGQEWVNFDEHHRRITCQDDGESFDCVLKIIMSKSAQ